MTELEEVVDSLLYEDEGAALDFKRDQYRFAGESPQVKGELLKDILAFANSWRREDAYILVGVNEVRGGRSEIVGIVDHLADADLQQFVNSKTQRPVIFSYRVARFGSKEIGVIHIPSQERPTYLQKDYGALRRNVVYIRRGSSTDQASPDEVARMGREQVTLVASPDLCLEIASSRFEAPEGLMAKYSVRLVEAPDPKDVPDNRESASESPLYYVGTANQFYYREVAEYVPLVERTKGFHVIVRNIGRAVAHDVRVECEADLSTGIILLDSSDFPRYPQRRNPMPYELSRAVEDIRRDVWVTRRNQRGLIDVELGKIQAGAEMWSANRVHVGAKKSGRYPVIARVFCDELSEPIESTLLFEIAVTEEDANLERLEELLTERAYRSDEWREYQESIDDDV